MLRRRRFEGVKRVPTRKYQRAPRFLPRRPSVLCQIPLADSDREAVLNRHKQLRAILAQRERTAVRAALEVRERKRRLRRENNVLRRALELQILALRVLREQHVDRHDLVRWNRERTLHHNATNRHPVLRHQGKRRRALE